MSKRNFNSHNKGKNKYKSHKFKSAEVKTNGTNNFLNALNKSFERNSSKTEESYYLAKNFHKTIEHILQIIKDNPNYTKQEIEESLINEFNDMTYFLQSAPKVLSNFYSYSAAKYLKEHPEKYSSLSKKLETSSNNFESPDSIQLNSFEDYLLEYVYSIKKTMAQKALNLSFVDNETFQEKVKSLDKLLFEKLNNNQRPHNALTESDIHNKKEFSATLLDNDLKVLTQKLITQYALAISNTTYQTLKENLRHTLCKHIVQTIQTLDKISNLNNYVASYVYQMYKMGFPEIANLFLKPNTDKEALKNIADTEPYSSAIVKFDKSIKVSQLKETLSFKKLEYSNLPIESLLALDTFWLNRLNKDLESYSETLFTVYNYKVIDSLMKNEIPELSENDFKNILIKMNTLYGPARLFLTNAKKAKQTITNTNSPIYPQISPTNITTCKDKVLENKLCLDNTSENNFSSFITAYFGNEYQDYFKRMLPNSSNNLKTDAEWYLSLISPILSSYKLKDNTLNNLVSCIIANDKNSPFLNFGLILNDFNENSTHVNIPDNVGLGFDIGLAYPVRLHISSYNLSSFINYDINSKMIPIYSGSKDFINSSTDNVLSAHIIYPYTDDQIKTINENERKIRTSPNKNFLEHICFIDNDHIPSHLKENDSNSIAKKYVNLDTGDIYIKSKDGKYIPFNPEPHIKKNSVKLPTCTYKYQDQNSDIEKD